MKSSILRALIALGFSAALSPVALLAQELNATIPFDFTVGAKSFTAGQYSVWPVLHNVLAIRSANGGTGVMTLTAPADPSKTPGKFTIVFHRYGDHYFLAGVTTTSQGWQVPASAAEKELVAKTSFKPVVVATALRSK